MMGAGSPMTQRDPRFLLDDDEPGCVRLHREGRLAERVTTALRDSRAVTSPSATKQEPRQRLGRVSAGLRG